MQTFTGKITKESAGKLTYIRLPFDAKVIFGKPKGSIYVKGTVNGVSYRSKLLSRGGGEQLLILDKALQKALGFTGEEMPAQITMHLDDIIGQSGEEHHTSAVQDSKEDRAVVGGNGMELLTAIKTRRSIRSFTDVPVSDHLIREILHAGLCAPSAKNKRPCHFITVQNRDTLAALGEDKPNAAMLVVSACAIVVCGDRNLQGIKELLLADCAAATQNMLLCIHALGLGGVWCDVAANAQWHKQIIQLLKLPIKIEPFAVIALGYPAEEKAPAPRWDQTKLHQESW